ncbi:MAG: YqgE/AlgH family protein [Acidimicrobiales bacterium]
MTPGSGRLLVATPSLGDPNFDRTVVLLLEHGPEGALGVVLNRPSRTEVTEPFPGWLAHVSDPPVVFTGGPVAPSAAIGLARTGRADETDGWAPLIGRLGSVDLSRDPGDLAVPVEIVRVFAGYAGWGAGQLEAEIGVGAWFVVEATSDDAFSPTPEGLWRSVLRRQRGRLALFADAPTDPTLN